MHACGNWLHDAPLLAAWVAAMLVHFWRPILTAAARWRRPKPGS